MKVLASALLTAVSADFLTEAFQQGWSSVGPVAESTTVELTFAVKQQNLGKLLHTFQSVSTPDSLEYGQYMSAEDVNSLTAPKAADVELVESYVRSLGGKNVRRTTSNDYIIADVAASAASQIFGGKFERFQNADGVTALRNPDAEVPEDLQSAVDFISPLKKKLSSGGQLRIQHAEPSANKLVNTPASLRKLYNVETPTESVTGNKQAFTGFLEQYWTNIDLQEFNTAFNEKGMGEKPARQVGDGKSGGVRIAGAEAELDAQYMMAMGLHVETEFWSFAGRSPDNDQNEPFLKFLYTLSNTTDAPNVISTSYGEDEDSMTLEYQNRQNVEFQKAGVRGITLLFASGDSGVGGAFKCSDKCAGQVSGKKCLQAMWPAASPYVTAVGGTGGLVGAEKGAGLSSGGFSYLWETPEWQKEAVATFLNNTDADQPDLEVYTQAGRGFPDISAQAIDYMVMYLDVPLPVAGTSAAAPTVGGILSLVNDKRIAAGQPTLGFVNPLLYKNPTSLNDIVGGNNPGCGSKGFTAVRGWDPITGLGTPNYEALAALQPTVSVVV